MPEVEPDPLLANVPLLGPPEVPRAHWLDVASAGFSLESDVLNLTRKFLAPRFAEDPDFDLSLELLNTFQDRAPLVAEDFIGVRSEAEFLHQKGEIDQRNEERRLLAQNPGRGLLFSGLASIFSPTSLVPLTLGAKGLKAVRQAVLLGTAAVGAQEAALRFAQPERTAQESALSIFAGAVFSGILGGAAALLTRGQQTRLQADMVTPDSGPSIPRSREEILRLRQEAEASLRAKAPNLFSEIDLRRKEILDARQNLIRERDTLRLGRGDLESSSLIPKAREIPAPPSIERPPREIPAPPSIERPPREIPAPPRLDNEISLEEIREILGDDLRPTPPSIDPSRFPPPSIEREFADAVPLPPRITRDLEEPRPAEIPAPPSLLRESAPAVPLPPRLEPLDVPPPPSIEFSPFAKELRKAERELAEAEARLEKAITREQQRQALQTAAPEVQRRLLARLLAVGVTEEIAEAQASVVARMLTSIGKMVGRRPEELLDDYDLTLTREFSPEDLANVRGSIALLSDRAIIELGKTADAATFMHESAHYILHLLQRLEGKGSGVDQELTALRKWLGDDLSSVEAQETFARGFEAYLLEGKVPVKGLERVFELLRQWLSNIYTTAADLNVDLSPEVKGIYDRLLGGGDETPAGPALEVSVHSSMANSLSAAAVEGEDAGPLKSAFGLENLAKPINPIIYNVQQKESPTIRRMTQALGDAGLKMSGNRSMVDKNGRLVPGRVTNPGGTIGALVLPSYAKLANSEVFAWETFVKYATGKASTLLTRATANLPRKGKLSWREHDERVGRAMEEGDIDEEKLASVEAIARKYRKDADHFYREGVKVGLFSGNETVKGAVSYLTRMYNVAVVIARRNEFEDILSGHFAKKMLTEFSGRFERLKKQEAEISDREAALKLPDAEVTKRQEKVKAEQQALIDFEDDIAEAGGDSMVELAADIAELRKLSRGKPKDWVEREQVKAEILRLEEIGGERLKTFKENKKALDRQKRNLDFSTLGLKTRQQALLNALDKVEELLMTSLKSATRAFNRFEKQRGKLSDEELTKEITAVKAKIDRALASIERFSEKQVRLFERGLAGDFEEFEKLTVKKINLDEGIAELRARLAAISPENRAALRAALSDAELLLTQAKSRIISARQVRKVALQRRIVKLDPKKAIPDELNRLVDLRRDARERLSDRARAKGATLSDLERGTFDFTETAKDLARQFTQRVIGNPNRIPFVDMIDLRGAELARMLDISAKELRTRDGVSFLEESAERRMRVYVETIAPDIELMRRFGTVNPLDGKSPWAMKIVDDFEAAREAARKLPPEKQEKRLRKIDKVHKRAVEKLKVLLERTRHTRGMAENPESLLYRLGKVALHVNTASKMGSVIVSSIPDPARVVMKRGLGRFFSTGVWPMVSNWKAFKLSAREGVLSGSALETIIPTRARGFGELLDDYARTSKFERGLEYLANRIGVVGFFAQWTDAWKQFGAVVENAWAMDAIEALATGKGTARQLAKYDEWANSMGIRPYVNALWEQIENNGSTKVGEVRYPNTEDWTGEVMLPNGQMLGLQQMYQGMLGKSLNDMIITKGIDNPDISDSNIGWRLIFQFRAFGLSSTSRTLLAGLQERDMAVVNGAMISLALGALSYYTWAIVAGGRHQAEMENASMERWLDEAIDRSGLLGVISELQRVGETNPTLSQFLRLASAPTSQRQGVETIEALLGPSYGLADNLFSFLAGVDDPTQATLHQARLMWPYQNVVYLRQIFDRLEELSGLPERRQ